MHYKTTQLPINFSKAFKDADIRGVYPSEIDEVLAYRVARAFVEEFSLTSILVARDMRNSSPALRDAFIAGARASGATVIDIGIVDTPALYFASGTLDQYGVVITASHNPAEFNGLKLVKAQAIPLTATTGLKKIQARVKANTFVDTHTKGGLKKKDIRKDYAAYIAQSVSLTALRPLRIVVDAGNGMGSFAMSLLSTKLPLEITPLYFELDGTFPNRGSNPTLAKHQKGIKKTLKEGTYDFGIAFDGDADRVAFFDEKGRYINSAVIGALIAEQLLKSHPKQGIVHTILTSRSYEEAITKNGGKALRARVGHAFIKEMMRKKKAVFGCEHSAHFYFKDNFYADSGILAFLYVAKSYAETLHTHRSFSALVAKHNTYIQTEEVYVAVTNKDATLEALVKHYATKKPLAIEQFDGITIRFPTCWFVVKKSVTEDVLEFMVEATTATEAKARQQEILTYLRQF